MKKGYVRPMMIGEIFSANEYIAACSDTKNEYYKFVCDAGGGDAADIYEGTYPNGTNLTEDTWAFIATIPGWFEACDIEHYVKKGETSPFTNGWYDADYDDDVVDYKFNVVIWKGENGDNVHATKALQNQIQIVEGNKS